MALAGTLTLSGCGIGFGAGTSQQKASGNGLTTNVDSIQLRALTVVADTKNPNLGVLIGTIINTADTDNALVGVAAARTVVAVGQTNVALMAKSATTLNSSPETTVLLNGQLTPGTYVNLQLMFADGKNIPVSLMVVTNEDNYADVNVTPVLTDSGFGQGTTTP
jgi:copper(I)-binding protein